MNKKSFLVYCELNKQTDNRTRKEICNEFNSREVITVLGKNSRITFSLVRRRAGSAYRNTEETGYDLELVRIEEFIPNTEGREGRPLKARSAIARSFVAKMVYNLDRTTTLIER
jgi:hypothetical protein